MKRMKILVLGLFLISCTAMLSFSQEVSEKKDISIFNLSFYDMSIPSGALGNIDEQIQSVFIELGRFNVIGMTYRLGETDVNAFIDKIKEFKEKTAEIPEEVNMGHALFTEADFEKLIGSFIIIIPAVTYFNVDRDGSEYKATVKTSYTVLNVETMNIIAKPIIETDATDENENEAVNRAINMISPQLAFEIKKVPVFTLKTGVLEVSFGEIILERGHDMGIQLGYEFVLLKQQTLKSGKVLEEEAGLVIVKNVSEEISKATILYGDFKEGDQLKEVPRLGVDITVYGHFLMNPMNFNDYVITAGIKGVVSLGFYDIRPVVGIEIPFINYAGLGGWILLLGIPETLYIGVEYNMYMGRMQVELTLAGGATGLVPITDTQREIYGAFALTHVGGLAEASLSWLITKDYKVTLEAGYQYFYSLFQDVGVGVPTYQGVIIGAGFTIKS
ncbi:MAG: hypothetical protein JW969_14210 [Spirochaetales bacterium]|nr:hypothetical protein [Spirochaetales bacterium]